MLHELLIACAVLVLCRGEANIGCLFSDSLCDDRMEWCYNDYAFGRCLPNYREITPEELIHYELDKDDLFDLEQQLQRLHLMGYQWSHPLTQCVIKEMMAALRDRTQYDSSVCSELSGDEVRSEEPALRILQSDPEVTPPLDPHNMAFVRYQPSEGNPHPEFADEVYFPPITDEDGAVARTPNFVEADDQPRYMPYSVNTLSKKSLGFSNKLPSRSMLLPASGIFSPLYNTPDKFRGGFETKDAIPDATKFRQPGDVYSQYFDDRVKVPDDVYRRYNFPGKTREDVEVPADTEEDFRQNAAVQEYPAASGFNEYNTPDNFREGEETRDEQNVFLPEPKEQSQEITLEKILAMGRNEIPVVDSAPGQPLGKMDNSLPIAKDGSGRLSPKLERLANLLYATEDGDVRALQEEAADKTGAAYTEGGLVFLPDQNRAKDMDRALDDGLESILGLGFKRPERLDVKKPGPLFTVINLAEQHHVVDDDDKQQAKVEGITASQLNKSLALAQSVINNKPEQENSQNQQVMKKAPDMSRPTPDASQYDVVDTTFAYIGFKQSLTSWHEGRRIVHVVAELLGLPPGTLSHSRVDRNEVTFKVEPNKLRMNASEVAKGIERIKENLKLRTGVEVTRAGIGDKTKLPTVLSLAPIDDHEFYIMSYVLVGAVASLVIACVALFFLRNHAKSREKLQGLAGHDTEAVSDYQDLCRARMAAKTTPEKPEPIGTRIASLSRESEASNNSPSSRSSTSSWSEEPALTNMDISTGHMVLSYMEDHLKNKDRLDQEWVALCAYEAEPCATMHALKPDNVNKNRYPDVLPYDHSRVVLNDLANISGGDYINASTITDHDPRSPAYIATQGPLPHTAPHFWQLVWEQGSVVMVMLSRLTEEGNAKCHRYWPEEGSELYHIYEVHLVSEHIWCDDYLVRSFYLKNLKTGETRTVTQFHFLSWPDNGVPTSTKALLEFRRKVNKSYRGRSCPIVVHCSDGVGRTGTYCLIDMVLNRMAKGAKEIDIAATLEHIRDQRANMVKTKEQFEFVLMAVAEEVNAILKALPAQQQQPPVQPPAQQPSPPLKK